ncbi:hypothetical protein FGO68_gene3159 [Halteria grandinella]|uniref:RNA 3'-terminal phosphate cyclase domain-containing protein n=1 Tax=Halteria grandinella TaxID=5974 RepID=A0A8J8NDL3_HALGN|nr:hypothetical protein FGO68_gene3159 [Halteria grandinella]
MVESRRGRGRGGRGGAAAAKVVEEEEDDYGEDIIRVDGGMLEGGGQLFRMSMALTYLLKKDCLITNIRGKRGNKGAGLGNQHLTGLKCLKQLIVGSKVKGDFVKSKDVHFKPGKNSIKREQYEADCKTPGSVHLISQMTLPCLLFQEMPQCKLTIKGGTLVNNSPPAHSYEHVFLPMIRKMGVGVEYEIKKHGLFPDIVGEVEVTIKKLESQLKPIDLVERGKLLGCTVHVTTTDKFHPIYTDLFKPQFAALFRDKVSATAELTIKDEDCPIKKQGSAKVLAITAILHFEQPTCLQANILLDNCDDARGETLAKELIEQLLLLTATPNVCTDEYFADQLLVFMALAEGTSRLTCKELSLHAETIIELLRQFVPEIDIQVSQVGDGEGKYTMVTVKGLGLAPVA